VFDGDSPEKVKQEKHFTLETNCATLFSNVNKRKKKEAKHKNCKNKRNFSVLKAITDMVIRKDFGGNHTRITCTACKNATN
jgi:hypothetical protein